MAKRALFLLLAGTFSSLSGPSHGMTAPPLSSCVSSVAPRLGDSELKLLMQRAFALRPADRTLLVLVDVPAPGAGHPLWATRLEMAHDWANRLQRLFPDRTLRLVLYRATGKNNGPLPERAWLHPLLDPMIPDDRTLADAQAVSLRDTLKTAQIVLALTQFSTTAPLKNLVKAPSDFTFRGASMPQFNAFMIPALRLDFLEVHRRCTVLKRLLDQAQTAELRFEVTQGTEALPYVLDLDLRHRRSTVSSGILHDDRIVANLPSGETFIVPYEGEIAHDPSRTNGLWPVEIDGEIVIYQVRENRAVAVLSRGPVSERERTSLKEWAYGNLAELGLGVILDMGMPPLPDTFDYLLYNEKLGPHVANGRSDHFLGGTVGEAQFSSPAAAVHIDRVYLPEFQSKVMLRRLDLVLGSGQRVPLVRDGRYVPELFRP